MRKLLNCLAVMGVVLLLSANARAEDYVITMKDKQFSPTTLVVPANKKILIIVKNLDAAKAEFESSDMDFEKIVNPHDQITVPVGPLDPGSYGYFNDFNRTMTGTITAQ